MLRPAASPWTALARHSWPHAARRAPAAARCINMAATTSPSEPSLEPQLNVDAETTAAASPGMHQMTSLGLYMLTHYQTPASKSLARPSRSSPFPSLRRKPSTPAVAPWFL